MNVLLNRSPGANSPNSKVTTQQAIYMSGPKFRSRTNNIKGKVAIHMSHRSSEDGTETRKLFDRRSEMMRRGRRAPARETMSVRRCTRARGAGDDARVTRR